jgi:hypothetical protein
LIAAKHHHPDFFFIYLPHLDYAAQRAGPNSDAALGAVKDLDHVVGLLRAGMVEAYPSQRLNWMVASEYVITEVESVVYPNRILRELGLLQLDQQDGREQLNLAKSLAWCLVDHQCGHVYIRDRDRATMARIEQAFRGVAGIAAVLTGDQLAAYGLDHDRSGDLVLVSEPDSWQAYYWWTDDRLAPDYARRVDIHRKPGYDPVELFWDRETNGVPLDATRVRGSHGAPALHTSQQGIVLCPRGLSANTRRIRDIDIRGLIEKALAV